jgi:hypothetical protein
MTSAEEFTEFANGRARHVVNERADTVTPISTAADTAGRPIPGVPLRPRALVIAPRLGRRYATGVSRDVRCQSCRAAAAAGVAQW